MKDKSEEIQTATRRDNKVENREEVNKREILKRKQNTFKGLSGFNT